MREQNSEPSLWHELKRRKVVRVTAVYVIAAAGVLQVLDVVVPALRLPDWSMTLFVVLAVAGLPVAAVLAWAFDITSEGVRRAPPEPDHPHESPPVPRGADLARASALPLALLALLLLVFGFGAWGLWLRPTKPLDPSPESVAVLPFTVRGDEQVRELGEGMVDLLSTKLDGTAGLRPVDPRALLSVLAAEGRGMPQLDQAKLVVDRLGPGMYVLGSIVEYGGSLQLSATLYAADGVRQADASVEGDASELFDLVDRLAGSLLAGRGGERMAELAAVTTSSLPALKEYLAGERSIREGRFETAMDQFTLAIQHDSTFVLAHYRYGIAAEWAGRGRDAEPNRLAMERFMDRATPHTRTLLRAHIAWWRGRAEEAERLYREIVAAHPDDLEAWFQLGEVLFHSGPLRGRPLAEATVPWERVLELAPDNLFAHVHLGRIASGEYQPDRVIRHSEAARAAVGDPLDRRVLELAALEAINRGDEGLEARVVAALRREPDASMQFSALYTAAFARDLDAGKRFARILMDRGRPETMALEGRLILAHLDLGMGRIRAAHTALDSLSALDPLMGDAYRSLLHAFDIVPVKDSEPEALRQRLEGWRPGAEGRVRFPEHNSPIPTGGYAGIREYVLGLLAVRQSAYAEAERRAEALEQEAARLPGSALGDLAHGLRARLDYARGRPRQALERLDQMRLDTVFYGAALHSSFEARLHERFLRAELLDVLGREEEALLAYRAVTDQSSLALPYLAPSHLRRGQIHERRGESRLAAQQYARFLALWEDADPELQPMVDNVRERLQRLTAEPAA